METIRRRTSRAASTQPPPDWLDDDDQDSFLTPPPQLTGRQRLTRQLMAMLRKHFILMRRTWRTTVLLVVLLPIVVCLTLFTIQLSITSSNNSIARTSTLSTWTLPGLPRCIPRKLAKTPCITLLYTPADAATTAIMSTFAKRNMERAGIDLAIESPLTVDKAPDTILDIVPVKNEEDLYNYAVAFPEAASLGVSFKRTEQASIVNWNYQIWYNFTTLVNTTVFGTNGGMSMRDATLEDPFGEQLVSLARGLDEALITTVSPNFKYNINLKSFPDVAGQSRYAANKDVVWVFGALFVFLPTMLLFIMALADIGGDKEQHLREHLELMGLNSSVYWASLFVYYGSLVVIQSGILFGIGVAFQLSFFCKCNPLVWLLTFILFGWATLAFAFFLSTLTTSTRTAVAAGFALTAIAMLYQLLAPGFWYTFYVDMERAKANDPQPGKTSGWLIGMFLPFFNFNQLYVDITLKTSGATDPISGEFLEGTGFGLGDLLSTPAVGGNTYQGLVPRPITSLAFLIMDIVVWMLLTWYMDNVVPGNKGFQQSPLFFLRRAYWSTRHHAVDATTRKDYVGEPPAYEDDDVARERDHALQLSTPIAVRITNLTKTFVDDVSSTTKTAVDRLCLTIQQGTILALLGQNGAGKSTTMSMLYGSALPTQGDAYIYGYNVRDAMDEIRKLLGVCTQFDRLFKSLSAIEHLELFAGIKGYDRTTATTLAHTLLKQVKLEQFGHISADQFSGGMKRRLSLLISTIGDPKLLILDEPTAGMDPVTRRHVWSFVEKIKQGRVIVLTTHSMEEADLVGDRISVMSRGRLIALGSSSHIKQKFGSGYRLSIIVDASVAKDVKTIVGRIAPFGTLLDDSGASLIYRFAYSARNNLGNLLKYLEENPHGLIDDWGISQSTLEDVFLRLMRM